MLVAIILGLLAVRDATTAGLHLGKSGLSLDNPNDPDLKSVVIKGIAKYKPGGSAMILSLLIQGAPGMMPGATQSPAVSPGVIQASVSTPFASAPPGVYTEPTSAPPYGPTGPNGGTPAQVESSSRPTEGPPPIETSGGPSTVLPSGVAPRIAGQGAMPTPAGATVPMGAPANGTGVANDYEQEGLDAHNNFRRTHGVPMMTLNKKMSEMALAYAKQIAAQGSLKHSSRQAREGQGENLSMGCKTGPNGGQTVTEAVNNWYNEVCSPGYAFGSESIGGAGHFTQVVWKSSTELGIGKADGSRGSMKCTYIVGRYKPAGNFIGQVKNNVVQGKFNRDAYCSKNRMRDYHPHRPVPRITSIAETVKRNRLINERKKIASLPLNTTENN